jgi:hypothetical protein
MDFGALFMAIFFTGLFFLILYVSIWLGRLRAKIRTSWWERRYSPPPRLPEMPPMENLPMGPRAPSSDVVPPYGWGASTQSSGPTVGPRGPYDRPYS